LYLIIVIKYNFIILSKQMQLFTAYSASQFDILIQIYKKIFSKFNKLLYCHFVVSTVDKGIENESMGLQGQELKNTQMKKRKTDGLPSRNSIQMIMFSV
uniref:Uncharacterized protein n=1 Tax=Bos indicus x Bos taurus TaxID=30522 RepID=A0A4W2CUG6_BOBOX